MVGTLITNAPEFSKTLLTQINKFCSLISESEYIDEENLNKFTEYFGSKKAIDNFKLDFYEISDEEKNDTLYYNIHDKVVNQYFIHLTIVPVSNSKITSIAKIFQNYCDMKMIKIVTHSRIRKRLKKQMKNVALSRRNDNLLKQKEVLSIGNIMWIIQSQSTDLTNWLKAVCQNSQFQGVLKRVESTINKLYNIFCSSYTIKNSFDTHFVVDNIDKMNSLSIKARNDLSAKLADIYQSYKSTDESFNPFIEIEQTEEKGFAMTEAQDRANQVISQITKELNDSLSTVIENLDSWLSQKASPEMLNLEAKQLVLKQKLKWEKMYTSRERLNYLKKIMNKYKKRR